MFASFVQLHDITCLFLSSSYVTSHVCFFRSVRDITCLLRSSSYVISHICFFRPVTWHHMFASFVQLRDVTFPPLVLPFLLISSIYFPFSRRVKNSVNVVTRLWAGRPKNRGSIPSRDKRFLSCPLWSILLWFPPNLPANRKYGLCLWVKTAKTWIWAFTITSATAEVKPACGYKTTGTYSFIEQCLFTVRNVCHFKQACWQRRYKKPRFAPPCHAMSIRPSLSPHEKGVSHQTAFSETSHLPTRSNIA